MSEVETLEILEMYAKHKGTEWWPPAIKSVCYYQEVENKKRLKDEMDMVCNALLGSLLTWLARKAFVYLMPVFEDFEAYENHHKPDAWASFKDHGNGVIERFINGDEPTIHHAALAAYEKVKADSEYMEPRDETLSDNNDWFKSLPTFPCEAMIERNQIFIYRDGALKHNFPLEDFGVECSDETAMLCLRQPKGGEWEIAEVLDD